MFVKFLLATPDLTPLEQKKNSALRQQLANMNKVLKMYAIRNGKTVWKTGAGSFDSSSPTSDSGGNKRS